MHVDDLANASIFLMKNYNEPNLINIGWGEDISIKELAILIASKLNYNGALIFDSTKPDGSPRKLLDTTKINSMGWKPEISISDGIVKTLNEYDKFVVK